MSEQHRTPRAHLQLPPQGAETNEEAFPVSPLLVSHLDDKFPIRLSPRNPGEAILTDQAELRGQQQVIDYLRQLSQNKE